jgi:hypothetical protein
VRDYYGATSKILQTFFQGPERVDVQIIGQFDECILADFFFGIGICGTKNMM